MLGLLYSDNWLRIKKIKLFKVKGQDQVKKIKNLVQKDQEIDLLGP